MKRLLFRKAAQTGSREMWLSNRQRLLNADTPFAVKEAYIRIRTNLMFCMTKDGDTPCRIFAVTSANPSEGKSLTAANLAICYAMLGKRTLLIDADLRKPTQRRLWNIKTPGGICDYLARIRPLEESRVDGLPLWIICAGIIPPNPSELLASDRMKRFIQACAHEYDYIIIDTPPINTVADAQIVSTFSDGMIVVAKSGRTTTDEIDAAVAAISRAGGNLCGVVVNGMDMKAIKHSAKYRYNDRYGYRYGNYDEHR